MTGYRSMLAIGLRSVRRQLLGWVIGLSAVYVATAASLRGLYPTPADLAAYAAVTESGSALQAINGRPFGLDTIGGVVAYEFGFVSSIALPLMGIHLMVRMTRAEEQLGRMELLRAGRVGRTAPVAAALTVITAAGAVIALVMAADLAVLGEGAPGVALYPVTMLLLCCWFAALAAAVGQLVSQARAVTAICLGVLVVLLLARGAGDVGDNVLVWFSPIGWAEQARPFAGARWWPALLLLATAVVFAAAAAMVAERRDLGRGVLGGRAGRPEASPRLTPGWGLALRRHRGSIVAWSVIAALIGAVFGVLADAVRRAMQGNATLQEMFGGGSVEAYLSFVVLLLALVGTGFAVQGVGRAAEDEPADRLEPLLAGTVSRTRWLLAQVAVLAAGTTAVTLAGGLALGVGDAATTQDAAAVGRYLVAAVAYLPCALVLLGLAVALYAARPALLPVGWLVFAWLAVVAVLADVLRIPTWLRKFSPLEWVGMTPAERVNAWAPVVGALLAAALVAAGVRLLRGRDIPMRRTALLHLRRA